MSFGVKPKAVPPPLRLGQLVEGVYGCLNVRKGGGQGEPPYCIFQLGDVDAVREALERALKDRT